MHLSHVCVYLAVGLGAEEAPDVVLQHGHTTGRVLHKHLQRFQKQASGQEVNVMSKNKLQRAGPWT